MKSSFRFFIIAVMMLAAFACKKDGGGSSSLRTPTTGVINHPCDNKELTHDGERKDPTIFVAK